MFPIVSPWRRSALVALTLLLALPLGPLPAQAAAWTVTLRASATSVPVGTAVTFTASASDDVSKLRYGGLEVHRGTGLYSGPSDAVCDASKGSTCSGQWVQKTAGTVQFLAQVWSYGAGAVVAASAPVTVTWTEVPAPAPAPAAPPPAPPAPDSVSIIPPEPSVESQPPQTSDGPARLASLRAYLMDSLAQRDHTGTILRLFLCGDAFCADVLPDDDAVAIAHAVDVLDGDPTDGALYQLRNEFFDRASGPLLRDLFGRGELAQADPVREALLGSTLSTTVRGTYTPEVIREALQDAERGLNEGLDPSEVRLRTGFFLAGHQKEWGADYILQQFIPFQDPNEADSVDALQAYGDTKSVLEKLKLLGIGPAKDVLDGLQLPNDILKVKGVAEALAGKAQSPKDVLDKLKFALDLAGRAGVEGAKTLAGKLNWVVQGYDLMQIGLKKLETEAVNEAYQRAFAIYRTAATGNPASASQGQRELQVEIDALTDATLPYESAIQDSLDEQRRCLDDAVCLRNAQSAITSHQQQILKIHTERRAFEQALQLLLTQPG